MQKEQIDIAIDIPQADIYIKKPKYLGTIAVEIKDNRSDFFPCLLFTFMMMLILEGIYFFILSDMYKLRA